MIAVWSVFRVFEDKQLYDTSHIEHNIIQKDWFEYVENWISTRGSCDIGLISFESFWKRTNVWHISYALKRNTKHWSTYVDNWMSTSGLKELFWTCLKIDIYFVMSSCDSGWISFESFWKRTTAWHISYTVKPNTKTLVYIYWKLNEYKWIKGAFLDMFENRYLFCDGFMW